MILPEECSYGVLLVFYSVMIDSNSLSCGRYKQWDMKHGTWNSLKVINKHIYPLSANPTKWSNTLKQFVGKLLTNCLSMFDYFVGLALKGLKAPTFVMLSNSIHGWNPTLRKSTPFQSGLWNNPVWPLCYVTNIILALPCDLTVSWISPVIRWLLRAFSLFAMTSAV